jgi:hypothetical protein
MPIISLFLIVRPDYNYRVSVHADCAAQRITEATHESIGNSGDKSKKRHH